MARTIRDDPETPLHRKSTTEMPRHGDASAEVLRTRHVVTTRAGHIDRTVHPPAAPNDARSALPVVGAVVPFAFEGIPVRVIDHDGEPWFVGRDVAKLLGYKNPQKAIRDHCKASRQVGKGVNDSFTPLDPQTGIIPERDVYRLIMRSNLPTAERFEEWVVAEVLPAIRKTGGYLAPAAASLLDDPRALRAALLRYNDRIIWAEAHTDPAIARAHAAMAAARAAEPAGHVWIADRIAAVGESLCISDTAKLLKIGPGKLVKLLLQWRWVYRPRDGGRLLGLQDKIESGLVERREWRSDDTMCRFDQTVITGKGRVRLAVMLNAQAHDDLPSPVRRATRR